MDVVIIAMLMIHNCIVSVSKLSTHLPPLLLINCLHDWITSNMLKLNTNKTELMVVAPKTVLQRFGNLVLSIEGCSICLSTAVCNLGFIFYSTLSFEPPFATSPPYLHPLLLLRQWTPCTSLLQAAFCGGQSLQCCCSYALGRSSLSQPAMLSPFLFLNLQ